MTVQHFDDSPEFESVRLTVGRRVKHLSPFLLSRMSAINSEVERTMIQFVYYHRALRFAYLNTVWEEFLAIHPMDDAEVAVSDIKLHFLCLDRSTNVWDLEEDVFLYFKFGDCMDEDEPEDEGAQIPGELEFSFDSQLDFNGLPCPIAANPSTTLLVTFDRKQNFNTALTREAYQLAKRAFPGRSRAL